MQLFSDKIVLAVDDDEPSRMMVTHLLKLTGAAVENAGNCKEAVDACNGRKYDLILLDHLMPGADGIETLHRIREKADGINADTPVIALTANTEQGAEQMYLSEGFAGYLQKPVVKESLEAVMCSCFGCGKEDEAVKSDTHSDGAGQELWLKQLEICGIQTEEGLRYADMDAGFYHQLLQLFAKTHEESEQKLFTIWGKLTKEAEVPSGIPERWEMWIAACHGLKGEARGLGAELLGEYFYQLELLGREKDRERIESKKETVLAEWKRVVDGIRFAGTYFKAE